MSDLDIRPEERVCTAAASDGPEVLVMTARKVWLGKTTEVARALPDREIRMIGAWCFLDHYGPEDVTGQPGMRVWAHPHTGLQTVSWLLEGEIEHRDGLGSRVMVRPGELHVMTAGHGIVHTELSLADHPPTLHGVQLWVALPEAARDGAPRFASYAELPRLERDGVTGTVLVGSLDGVASPAEGETPLVGADLTLHPGSAVDLAVEPGFEHGVFVMAGAVRVEETPVGVDQLVYLGTRRRTVRLASDRGGRVLLLGGEPFAEEIVMWWNFVGRTHAEVVGFREAWERRTESNGPGSAGGRFAPVLHRDERVMEAPPMPTVALKPRPRRRAPR